MPLQAVEARDGGVVSVEPESLPICRLRPCVGCPACADHVGVIARARTGDPELNWDPARTGVIPEMNVEGRRRGSAISPCPSARVPGVQSNSPPRQNAPAAGESVFTQGRQKEGETGCYQSPLQHSGLEASARVRRLLELPLT
jgi:hypothetical protein